MAINSIIGSASSASAKYEEINISIKKTTVELNSTDAAVFTKTADEQSADKNKLIGKPADPETQAQAQADIAEDGYWGVEQTSDRILDFAKALAGTDSDMAEKMLEAIKEGFKQAGAAWGEDLPELCQDTMKASLQKVEDWIASLKNPSPEETAATEA